MKRRSFLKCVAGSAVAAPVISSGLAGASTDCAIIHCFDLTEDIEKQLSGKHLKLYQNLPTVWLRNYG